MQELGMWRRLAGPAIVLLSPLLVITLTPTLLLQASWLDPYVYTAYIHDYRQTYLRFHATYYSNRIAAIDLSRLVLLFVDSDAGYYIVRFILLVAASAAIFAIARRFYGAAVAMVAVVLLSFSPWYLRSIASNYVDGFAITYLFVAVACLIAPRRHLVLGHAFAGAFFAMAVNTNLWTLAFAGCFAPAWYALYRQERARHLSLLVAATLCGFVAMYAALGASLHLEFPDRPLFFEGKTLLKALDQLGPAGNVSFQPLGSMIFGLHRAYYLLVPPVLCVALWISMMRLSRGEGLTTRPFALASGLYLTMTIAVYLFAHFVMHHGIVGVTYYFSYSLVASYLVMVALIGESARSANSTSVSALMAVGAGIYVLEYAFYSPTFAVSETWPLRIWAVAAFALPLCLLLERDALRRLVVLLFFLVAVPIPFYHSFQDYHLLHSQTRRSEEWDVYHGAQYFQSAIGRVADPADVVKFWYGGESADHKNLNSIQSMYLWGFSRVGQMPRIDQTFLNETASARYLVLLGVSASEIEDAVRALVAAHIPFKTIQHDQFTGAVWSFNFATLELTGHRRAKS